MTYVAEKRKNVIVQISAPHPVNLIWITATPILREIEFWQIQTVQKCHFWQF